MPIGLLLAHHLDAPLRPRLREGAERAGVTLRVWEPGENLRTGDPAPAFIVAPLAAGVRRLAPDLVHLADDLYPEARVLLISRDPLVRPHLELSDGRLVLIDPGTSGDAFAEHFRAAGRWRLPTADGGRSPIQEVRAGGGRALVVRVGAPGGALVCVPGAGGVIALLGRDTASESAPAGIDSALAAWAGQSEHLPPPAAVSELLAPWTMAAAIDGRRWLFGGSGARLYNQLRMPACWTGDDRARRLDTGPGDVALVIDALPDDAECAPDDLLAAARDGGRALAEHLVRRAQARGLALLAAVIDGVNP